MTPATESENIDELLNAFFEASPEIPRPKKDAKNPFFKSKYADLSTVMDTCEDVLAKHDMRFVHQMVPIDGVSYLRTKLLHRASKQWFASYWPMKPAKENDPQAFGAASTYARRYTIMAMLCMCPEDDDGNLASGRNDEQAQKAAEERKAFVAKTQAARGVKP